jgi:hypothetical protein
MGGMPHIVAPLQGRSLAFEAALGNYRAIAGTPRWYSTDAADRVACAVVAAVVRNKQKQRTGLETLGTTLIEGMDAAWTCLLCVVTYHVVDVKRILAALDTATAIEAEIRVLQSEKARYNTIDTFSQYAKLQRRIGQLETILAKGESG